MIVHIVEDDEAVADALAIALEGLDRRAVTYCDGESFLAQAAPVAEDWVIVDIGLPGKSGTEVVQELMTLSDPPSVVAISGKSKAGLMSQLRDLPNLKVLRKPLSIDMLAAVMA